MLFSLITEWYQKPPGSWLLQLEKAQLHKWLPLSSGSTVIQVGGVRNCFDLHQQVGRHEYYFLSSHADKGVDIITSYQALPIQPNSVNLALIVHLLEFIDEPTVLLNQLYEALTPDGKILIFCFNPWSLWGIHQFFSSSAEYPWHGSFKSPARVRQWLKHSGYTVLKGKTLGFCCASQSKFPATRSMFFEAVGQIMLPKLGAVTVFLAEKRIYGSIRHVRYAWQSRRFVKNGIVEASTRILNRSKKNDR